MNFNNLSDKRHFALEKFRLMLGFKPVRMEVFALALSKTNNRIAKIRIGEE
jgi:hypothetical protein